MKKITLESGHEILIDAEDFDLVSRLHLFVNARGGVSIRGRNQYLFRALVEVPPDHTVDYRNRDRWDLRKQNLKVRAVKPETKIRWSQLAGSCYVSKADCKTCPVPKMQLETLYHGCQVPKAVKWLLENAGLPPESMLPL